jgi:hypothetical protein
MLLRQNVAKAVFSFAVRLPSQTCIKVAKLHLNSGIQPLCCEILPSVPPGFE